MIAQHKVMVIAIAVMKLPAISTNVLSDGLFLPEIKGRTLHRRNDTCRQGVFIVFRKEIGVNLQQLPHGVCTAAEVKIAVIGEVYHGVLIGNCLHINIQHQIPGKCEANGDLQRAGITLIPIR